MAVLEQLGIVDDSDDVDTDSAEWLFTAGRNLEKPLAAGWLNNDACGDGPTSSSETSSSSSSSSTASANSDGSGGRSGSSNLGSGDARSSNVGSHNFGSGNGGSSNAAPTGQQQ